MMVETAAEFELALREAAARIVLRFDPDKIIVFGSAARGEGAGCDAGSIPTGAALHQRPCAKANRRAHQ